MEASVHRQVRAGFDGESVVVYQAYPPAIADAALAAGTFVAPFKRERMTWIKPSFLWMMYRCGWAGKEGQERVLAVRIRRSGFEWALRHASLSHYDSAVHDDHGSWRAQKDASPVRVQWDPERSLRLEPRAERSIQIGLSGVAVQRYVDEWITDLRDVTDLAHRVHGHVRNGDLDAARAQLPAESVYPLPGDICTRLGATY
ncbi:DUF4291 domain-containing protein [Streptomyces phytohabitans]